jgi:hemolysin activation/secretion protein
MKTTTWLACFAIVVIPQIAAAQAPFERNPGGLVPQGSPIDRDLRRPFPTTAPGLPRPEPAAPVNLAPGQSSTVVSAVVNGSSVYPAPFISSITDGLVGLTVPLDRIEEARQKLLMRYRNDGYLLTTVSTVLNSKGELRFNVVEGYIADVKLQGDIGPAGVQVLRFLNRLLNERPIRVSTLERYLLLATDVPGITLRSVLRPGSDDPAAVTLIAEVSRKAVDGLLSADNRAFRQTGPEQSLAVASFNSFTQFGERTELSFLSSFNGTQLFGQAATEFFIGSSGLKVRMYGGAGDTQPNGNLASIGYDGFTRVFGAQASYPVIRSRQETLVAVGAFDAIESNISGLSSAGGSSGRISFDSLRVFRTGVDYALQDVVLGGERTGVTNVSIRLSKGISALGASQFGDPQAGRVGEHPSFFKFNAEVSRTQDVFKPWSNARVSVFGLVAGQVSNTVLPQSEKFFLGGIRYNRGFYAGQVTGDNAITTAVELQLNTDFPVTLFNYSTDIQTQFYVFHDWGETWENQAADANHRLRSAGFGVRAQLTPNLAAELEAVFRLTRHPQGADTVSALPADAVYWRAVSRF